MKKARKKVAAKSTTKKKVAKKKKVLKPFNPAEGITEVVEKNYKDRLE